MKVGQSLRSRLVLTYTALIVVGFMGLVLLAGRQIQSGAVEDFEHSIVAQSALVARGLRETVEHFAEGEIGQASLSAQVQDYADQLNGRILLIDSSGRAWLASDGNIPGGDLRGRPEVAAALESRVTYDTRGDESGNVQIHSAAPIVEDGRVLGIVSLDIPLSAANSLVIQRWLTLAGAGLALAAIVVGASFWLSSSLTRPLARLRNSALRMAEGDLTQQLAEDRQDEIGQLARAFNHMARRVQSMLEEQRSFASNASHELRTPLTTIRLRSEALRAGHVDPATAREYVVEIDEEVQRLSGLVEDLILLSRLDSGRARFGDQEVDVERVLRHLLAEYGQELEARQIELSFEAAPNLPPVLASINHLRVVFRNLLDNAIKYTGEGGTIACRLACRDTELQVTISDTGRGIAPDDLEHLFERFYRADKARTRDVPGAGLGLSLVRDVVQAYDGRVQIDSPGLNQGTVVQVWLPFNEERRGQSGGA